MKRKIKPYPAIVPDDIEPEEEEELGFVYLAVAAIIVLFVIVVMLAGMAGYMWGMLRP